MLSDATDLDYQIADHQRPAASVPRSLAFPEGVSSHTKIAVPDAIEDDHWRVAEVETPPGLKVADLSQYPGQRVATPPSQPGLRVARPPMISMTGDFRLPIKLSGADPRSTQAAQQKLLLSGPSHQTLRAARR